MSDSVLNEAKSGTNNQQTPGPGKVNKAPAPPAQPEPAASLPGAVKGVKTSMQGSKKY